MKTIGKEWAKIDPAAALDFANSKSGELGSALAKSALNEWASRDLDGAADWLASADTRTRGRLASAFVEAWAKDDAAGALEWCALNLSGSSLAQAVGASVPPPQPLQVLAQRLLHIARDVPAEVLA